MKTVQDLLIQWLNENGYDGIWDGDECGCFIEDLFPCDSSPYKCMPGYKGWMEEEECWGIGPTKKDEK